LGLQRGLAGGDIDDDERARVSVALETWPELKDELAPFEELERTLRSNLTATPSFN
jgi:anti-sigma factor RsiW